MAEVPITTNERNRGWYISTEKKPGTPNGWVFTTFRGMSTWGECDKMRLANAEPVCSRVGGASGRTVCKTYPGPDCKPPTWVGQFRSNWGLFEFSKWEKSAGLPFTQKLQVYKKEMMIGGAITSVLLIGVIIVVLRKSKKKAKVIKKEAPAMAGNQPDLDELVIPRSEAKDIWKNMNYINRLDILEEADIDNEKRLARMSWKRIIKSELNKSEADRLIAEVGEFWSWKFSAPKNKRKPISTIGQIGTVLTEVVGWKDPKKKIRYLPKDSEAGTPATYQFRVGNQHSDDISAGLEDVKGIRFYPTTIGDNTVFDIISSSFTMPSSAEVASLS